MTNSKAPNDGQNLECDKHLRYVVQSGQSSIHGDTLYELQTQEAQSFAFHSGTGQGGSGGGPGTGKAVLYTPGSSTEVLGEGLKVRTNNDLSQLPAKIIKCKKGDVVIDCENGDITLRGRNINFEAIGGDQGGQFNIKATRVATIDSPDIRLQGEKILIKSDNTCNIISKGFLELKSGFTLSASFADESFGTMSQVLKSATTINPPTI
jgi:hypothetical protein|tara:strand:+ start:2616 stop:3239 length:624 start_codon:yes stop_codon:yes gene_type:complete